MTLVVAAIGGNALRTEDGVGAPSEWFDALTASLPPLLDLLAAGHGLVITHGNGPQVGEELLRMEISKPVMPALTLDLCVAETEGSLGYAIQQVLGNLLRRRGLSARVASVVTQVLVDAGMVPVAVGGGGIPVVYTPDCLRGVEAVIEKDLATIVLARDLGAHVVFFLTGVYRVAVDFGQPGQRFLDRLTIAEARRLLAAGECPPGSMGPKVEAAVEFVERGGERAVITSLDRMAEAVAGRAGTTIVR